MYKYFCHLNSENKCLAGKLYEQALLVQWKRRRKHTHFLPWQTDLINITSLVSLKRGNTTVINYSSENTFIPHNRIMALRPGYHFTWKKLLLLAPPLFSCSETYSCGCSCITICIFNVVCDIFYGFNYVKVSCWQLIGMWVWSDCCCCCGRSHFLKENKRI